jgi:cobaltochelatase CobT
MANAATSTNTTGSTGSLPVPLNSNQRCAPITATADTDRQPPAHALQQARQQRTIQGALPIVARAIGRRMDVEVHIGGNEAETDGRVIRLPTLPFTDPDVEILAFGFLEHEAAHIRYTKPVESTSELHHGLCNVIEDVRVERELAREFPGFASTLRRLVAKLVQDSILARPSESDPPGTKLSNYLLYRLRAEVLSQDGLSEYATQAESIFRQSFTPGACTRIGSVIGRVPAMRSTQDASNLAAEVLSILKDESKDPPPPAPRPQATPGPTGAAGTAPGDSGSDSNATDAAASSDGSSPDPHAQGRANLRDLLTSASPELGPNLSTTVGQALEEAANQSIRTNGGSAGGFGRADEPIDPPPGNPQQILSDVHEASMALRVRLRSMVESVRHSRRGYTRHGTRLAPQRAVRAMLGDSRLFAIKRPGRDVNSAIEVLCDRSGSLHGKDGEPMRIAARSLLAAVSGLSGIRGASVEAAVFPGCHHDVELLTQFTQSLRSTATRYASITAQGGTPMYEALMWGFERLLMRPEPRRILVCLTDGEPPKSTYVACQQAIAAAIAGGIEVYAIGIKVPDISNLFPISHSIDDVADLADAMFRLLQTALTGRARA